jgi:hypothetical protein
VYVLVRKDLSPAQQIVQSCHAAIEAARALLPAELQHPHLIVCGVHDEAALWRFLHKLQLHNIRFQAFLEPDQDNQLTALATEPVFDETRRLFRNLRLLTPMAGEEGEG